MLGRLIHTRLSAPVVSVAIALALLVAIPQSPAQLRQRSGTSASWASGWLAQRADAQSEETVRFPWPAGQEWLFTQDYHNHEVGGNGYWLDGARFLDFYPPANVPEDDIALLAATSGTVSWWCGGGDTTYDAHQVFIYITDASGAAYAYGHIDRDSFDTSLIGQTVQQGQYLGKPYNGTDCDARCWVDGEKVYDYATPCGLGTGIHVHWGLPNTTTPDDPPVVVDGWSLEFSHFTPDGDDIWIWTKEGEAPRSVYGSLPSTNVSGQRALDLAAQQGPLEYVSYAVGASAMSGFSMDPDARYFVEVTTEALDPLDANDVYDVYLTDLFQDPPSVTLVSATSGGVAGNGASSLPTIPAVSSDGQYVLFYSAATNLIDGDPGSGHFLRTLSDPPKTVRLFKDFDVQACADLGWGLSNLDMSADARYVSFETRCPAAGNDTSGTLNVYIYDVARETTQLASRNWTDTSPAGSGANSNSSANLISGDGSSVIFRSAATDLVDGDTNNIVDVFRYSRTSATVERVSVTDAGNQVNGNGSYANAISYDGALVLFATGATNLGSASGLMHLYLRDMQNGTTTSMDRGYDGTEADAPADQTGANIAWTDSRYVVFRSLASNLVEGDSDGNAVADLFIYDRGVPGGNVQRLIWTDEQGNEINLQAENPRFLADGQILSFHSNATNLTPATPDVSPFRGLFLLHLGGHKANSRLDPIGLEVTQGIQCFRSDSDPWCSVHNSVPLIAGKSTMVRAHVSHTSEDTPIYGTLLVDNGVISTTLAPVSEPGTAAREYDRGRYDHGLWFRLPHVMASGTVTMHLGLSTAADAARTLPTAQSANLSTVAHFENGHPLTIGYVPVGIRSDEDSPWFWPDESRIADADAYLRMIYPIPGVTYFRVPSAAIAITAPPDLAKARIKHELNKLDKSYQLMGAVTSLGPLWDQLFGWVSFDAIGTSGSSDPDWHSMGSSRVAYGSDTPDPTMPGMIMAHEIGHNIGLRHPFEANDNIEPPENVCDVNSSWPYDDDMDESYDYSIHEYGYDPGFYGGDHAPVVPTTWDDFMIGGHCGAAVDDPKWVSPFHYAALYEQLPDHIVTSSLPAQSLMGVTAIQTVLLVSGEVHSDGTGSLEPAYMHNTDATLTQPAGTAYCLTLEDGMGAPLVSDCFDLSFIDPETGDELDMAYFTRFLTYESAAERLSLSQGAAELDAMPVSVYPPTVTVLYPNGGESLGDTVTVTWVGSDQDGDPLTYALDYSTDDGMSWYHLALDLTTTSRELDLTKLPGSATARFQVRATDGIHTVIDASDAAFTVPDHHPAVTILLPAADLTVIEGQSIELQGSTYDMEDGRLDDIALSWTSDVDGALGAGHSLLVAELSVGTHLITLSAQDSNSQAAEDAVAIEVVASETPEALIARQNSDLVLTWSEVAGAAGYRIYTSTYPYFDVQSASYVDVTALSYTDSGAAAAGDRYYKVAARYDLGGESAPSTELGSVSRAMALGWNLVALPFAPVDGALDAALGAQLYGTEDPLTADQVMVWDATSQTFSVAWFCGGPTCESWGEPWANHWLANDYSQSTITLGLDRGFWLHNRGGITETVVFVGVLPTGNRSVPIESGWQIVSYGFADYRYLDSAGLLQGGSDGPLTANQVLRWNPDTQTYEAAWYCGGPTCESWGYPWANHWLRNDYANSAIVLWPGYGYWYLNRGEPFTWYSTWTGR